VSAVSASPAAEGSAPVDPVRALQHALYRAAKADPGRRFHALRDKVFRRDVLWRAWVAVCTNNGAPGIDKATLEHIEQEYGIDRLLGELAVELRDGTHRPMPTRRVWIPKPGTSEQRPLSIPTVADRIAQTVVALQLQPRTESIFHDDSFGYRPGRSAHDALERCRQRCWQKEWVLDCDIQKFFDSLDHRLVVKAVKANTDQRWVLLYVKRWLTAPLQRPDGTLQDRDCGTPQGSAVSPVLANLVLHYAFDMFLAREFPTVTFERFADDAVVHCVTERQARQVREALTERLAGLGLRLHPDKTKIVYCCKDAKRRADYEHVSFTFLGIRFSREGWWTVTVIGSSGSHRRSARLRWPR
jgi:RNA-directed DNA polymerase